MMRTVNEATPPVNLIDYLDSNVANHGFMLRRRSAITRTAQNDWVLAISVVQAFPDERLRPEPRPQHLYDRLRLLEDWLDIREAQQLVESIQSGTITLGDVTLTRTNGANWQSEFVTPPNNFMDRVGFVVQKQFEQHQVNLFHEPLISATEPYYPDDASAVQDWAQLTLHHGDRDGRNGHIIFLLPEARAYFTSAISDNGKLRLTLAGAEVGRKPLIVKGAFRHDGKLHHFEGNVAGGEIELPVPNEIERLEYALIDSDAQLYDLQRESWGMFPGVIRQRAQTADDALIRQIRDATESGENDAVEFKPFIDPNEPPGGVRERTKFREVLRTIAAFANAQGGTIFFGIQDGCLLEGIQENLTKWGNAKISDKLCAKYKGALTNKLRDHLLGDSRFWIAFATVDGALVAVLSVSPFERSPVGLKDDGLCYVRRGSSNKHLLPHEWLTVLGFASE